MSRQTQRYRVADINLVMTAEFGFTIERSKKYIAEDVGEEFDKTAEVIEVSRELIDEQCEKYKGASPDDLEYAHTARQFYVHLLKHQGMMLHSSAVVVDGYAYLFSADSGTGKSTHTGLWLEYFKDKAFIINDDKPALRKIDGEWYVYGTPWSGKHDISVNTRAKLGAIVFLERSEKNWIENMDAKEAVPKFLAQTIKRFSEVKDLDLLLTNINAVLQEIPIYKMGCNISEEAVTTAYEVIRRI